MAKLKKQARRKEAEQLRRGQPQTEPHEPPPLQANPIRPRLLPLLLSGLLFFSFLLYLLMLALCVALGWA